MRISKTFQVFPFEEESFKIMNNLGILILLKSCHQSHKRSPLWIVSYSQKWDEKSLFFSPCMIQCVFLCHRFIFQKKLIHAFLLEILCTSTFIMIIFLFNDIFKELYAENNEEVRIWRTSRWMKFRDFLVVNHTSHWNEHFEIKKILLIKNTI